MSQKPKHERKRHLLENQFLQQLVAVFPRHPEQLNAFLESDAELIALDEQTVLALTTDSLVEEIETGLYQDPFLIGWVSIMASLSDLAAVGARPLGLLLTQHLPHHLSPAFLEELQKGIIAACQAAGTYILGGDTSTTSGSLQIGATAIGWMDAEKIVKRIGCQVGDKLYASAKMGTGNAYAFSRFFAEDLKLPFSYQPIARLGEGMLVRQYGSACIDTSDGFFPALANLIEINEKGFRIYSGIQSLIPEDLQALARQSRIPAWFFLAGPHGEFELLFTIPPQQEAAFLEEARVRNWNPLPLGIVTELPELFFLEKEGTRRVDPFRIANLFVESEGNPKRYLEKLSGSQLFEEDPINQIE